jgi:MGT family glycosyltransferase
MANIVFLSVPAYGHLNPVLPVIAELVRRGHSVTVFDDLPFAPLIATTGAKFVAYPKAVSMEDMSAVLMRGDLMATFELFLRASPRLYEFCVTSLLPNIPNVLVIDGIALWGEMVGRRLTVPTVVTSPFFVYELARNTAPGEFLHNFGLFARILPRLVLQWILVALKGVWLMPLHWPLLPIRGNLTLMLTSRELHPPSPIFSGRGWGFVGASIDAGTRHEQFDFANLHDGPLLYVSLGTLHHGNTDFFRRAIEAFKDFAGQVLVSVGRGTDVSQFAGAPPNFMFAQAVPQLAVLERASVFVTHAGLNSMHESLLAGVPMVAVPQQFEQLHNALAMTHGGAGITLDTEAFGGTVSPAELRQSVETIIADLGGYRARASALGQSLRQAGGFTAAADRIEAMARG